jgi:hypothetical protein
VARAPDWFARLDAILDVARSPATPDWLGRAEVKKLFAVSERDAIRLLHKFGAAERNDALALAREALVIQLEAVRRGDTFTAFARQRQGVAENLATARAEAAARQFRVRAATAEKPRAKLADLPATLTWRRVPGPGPGRFEILYDDGADLLWQLAEFLAAAGSHRREFLEATEPADDR